MLSLRKTLSTGDIDDSTTKLNDILSSELASMTACDLERLLSLETQIRIDHQERVQQLKTSSRIKFLLPPTPPRSPKLIDFTMTRRWSLPVSNKHTKWRLFVQSNNNQDTVITLGSKVRLIKRPLPIIGTVKYVGGVHFNTGEWLGVELDYRVGNTDGSVDNIRYFQTKSQQGLFVERQEAIKEE